jgi:hypothetical protein
MLSQATANSRQTMQRTMDYVHIPVGAHLLLDGGTVEEYTVSLPPRQPGLPIEILHSQTPGTSLAVNSPDPKETHQRSSSTSSFLVNQTLTQVLNIPSLPTELSDESSKHTLLTSRHPLSLPITTVNFRRFVSRSGAIFWFQDRIEEIVLWKRGQKYTIAFMAAYTFLCKFLKSSGQFSEFQLQQASFPKLSWLCL